MDKQITGISSMATRNVLAELATAYRERSGVAVDFESVGGVDAAKRIHGGENFDVVVLAADAICKLADAGRVVADSTTDVVRSPVAIAVGAGKPRPDISSEQALQRAVLAARTLGYSTGPSGVELMKLFERWNIADTVRDRLVQARPGVPVGTLVASGEVEIGFQQLSELMHVVGVDVIGTMPPGCEIISTFSAGLCASSTRHETVRDFLAFMHSAAAAEAKRRHGMDPA
jgi:molybdate transport system substrate-binding protein